MNKKYLFLLRKEDVIDLFKYGKWYAYCTSCEINDDVFDAAEKLFRKANIFEYSIEYYIVQAITPSKNMIEMDDVLEIYPLDRQSYNIGLSTSPEIRLSEPIFEDIYNRFQESLAIKNAMKGVDNVFSVFGVEQPKRKKSFIVDQEIADAIKDSYQDTRVEGDHSIWYYLLRYDRHQPYPKDNRGFFLDFLHAYMNYEKKTYIDVNVSQSKIGSELIKLPTDVKYKELVSFIDEHSEFKKRCNKAKKDFYKVAPLYLILKDVFSEGFSLKKEYMGMTLDKFVSVLKTNYDIEDLQRALYLLGLSLGRDNTYQYVYTKNKLKILK